MVLAEDAGEVAPRVRIKLVERDVVEGGGQLGRGAGGVGAGDSGRPCLASAGDELGVEMLPRDFETFVVPGDGDVLGARHEAVVAHLEDAQGDATAHGLGDGDGDFLPGGAGGCPETAKDFLVLLNADKGAGGFVAGAPKGGEGFAGLRSPSRGGKGECLLYQMRFGVGREDADVGLRGDGFAETVGGGDDDAVDAGGKREGKLGEAGAGGGGESLRGNGFGFDRPILRGGGVDIGRGFSGVQGDIAGAGGV